MIKRRDALRLGLASVGAGLASGAARAQVETNQWTTIPQTGQVFPGTFEPGIVSRPSPAVDPFTAPLHVMRIAEPVDVATLCLEGVFLAQVDPAQKRGYRTVTGWIVP